MKTTIGIALTQNLKELNLSNMVRHLKGYLRQARENGLEYEEFLLGLTKIELQVRADNRYRRLLREAKFPRIKTLETFSYDAAPGLDRCFIEKLATGDYIWQRRNIIFVGRSGTGKTHLAIALGINACRQGVATRFTTGYDLVNQLVEARSNKDLRRAIHKYGRCGLLVLDDFGSVPCPKEGGELLYQVLAERYERGSVIITTGLDFSDWSQVLCDSDLTATLLDRLTHRAHIISCTWQSYRLRENIGRSVLH